MNERKIIVYSKESGIEPKVLILPQNLTSENISIVMYNLTVNQFPQRKDEYWEDTEELANFLLSHVIYYYQRRWLEAEEFIMKYPTIATKYLNFLIGHYHFQLVGKNSDNNFILEILDTEKKLEKLR